MDWKYPLLDDQDPNGSLADTLGLTEQEMRSLGYKMVDMVVDRALCRNAEPAILTGTFEKLERTLGGPLPHAPTSPEALLEVMAEYALSHQQHGDHHRYFARVPGPAAFAAVVGDWMATGFNAMAGSWAGGSGPAAIELITIGWLAELLGLPQHCEGVIVSGGSLANLTGLAAARAECGQGLVYFSDQTHASVKRDLREMGFHPDQLRELPTDGQYRLSVEVLEGAISSDLQNGAHLMAVIASAGSTNTGAQDPLHEIADLCAKHGLWFHVDGAYGAPAALTPSGRAYLSGMERADSLAVDPHKWLFQPYDAGVCLVTRPGALERCFAMSPEYLKDVRTTRDEVNFGNRSLELSRRSRAMKIWMSLKTYGAPAFREAVQKGIDNAEIAERYIRSKPDIWEILTPAQIGIVCFALKDQPAEEHARRAQAVSDTGFACVTSTSLKGRSALRLCLINPLTTQADIMETIDRLEAA